ncbi:hypothetical protein AL755_08450 [Arthrobacter sp. ERGS1:01]|uniref:CHAP domain-containing protein n=1 Tax=Arthrobacter sp. ERGS1:01 TaxID=1704044 RepID=UPI0006B58158|nr:CHAP domain-containing protein [Arthrobacter sp. ERGS1:01]ALE05501.1 hypothetical protein AL755_08450 [Arthrobacter sp. ERGS1:01]
MTTPKQEAWFATAIGRATDPDNVGGLQCVDAAKDYAEHIFGIGWKSAWPGAGNAKDMLYTYNPDYFDRIPNDPSNPGLIPRRGDVIIWGGTADDGINPYGHIAVVVSANTAGVDVIQQDGFLQVPMYAGTLPYSGPGTGVCTGWLRPKLSANLTPQSNSTTPTAQKDWFDMAEPADLRKIIKEEIAAANPWAYKNPKLEKDDAYALLRATRTYVVKNAGAIAGLTSLVGQLAKGQGVPIDLAAVEAAAAKGAAAALAAGVDLDATVTIKGAAQ